MMASTLRGFQRKLAPLACLAGGAGGLAFSARSLQTVHAEGGLDSKNFNKYKLAKKEQYNHNSAIYTFKVDGQRKLPVSSFVLTKCPGADGKDVVRPYTPLNADTKDEIRLLVKTYPSGTMSKHIGALKLGDSLEIKGPLEKFPYKANSKKEIGMLAGGTGITPMLQIIEEILANPNDKTRVTLVFANHTEKDILLKERLDALQALHENFHVHYIVTQPGSSWRGLSGRLDQQLVGKLMPSPSLGDQALVLVCGPLSFYESISGTKAKDYTQGELSGFLKNLGFNKEQVFKL